MRIACAEAFAQVPDRSPTMIYLKSFHFPDGDREFDFLLKEKRQCYDTFYPFKILSRHRFEQMDFDASHWAQARLVPAPEYAAEI